jgi:hypothetical protein
MYRKGAPSSCGTCDVIGGVGAMLHPATLFDGIPALLPDYLEQDERASPTCGWLYYVLDNGHASGNHSLVPSVASEKEVQKRDQLNPLCRPYDPCHVVQLCGAIKIG